MDAKKISFGFSKVAKKPNILPSKQPKDENKVELIKCLEGKEIKLVAERVEAAPLIIEMQGSQKTSAALASLMKRRAVLLGEEEPDPEEVTPAAQSVAEVTAGPAAAENLEQRAARELLAASQNNGDNLTAEKLVLPAVKADELPLDGAKEATLDDYDNIPIQQFGLAMLRGMGWVDPPPKKKGSGPIDDAPFLRPKGMGLGADKALKPKALLVQPEKNELLEIKKQAFVRILGGKQKDQYGQIEGFDDHAGRVIVKMAIGGAKEAFNEFLCQPVSRKEYAQYGKCINTAKYEEFKKQENEHGQIILKQEKPTERRDRDRREDDKSQRDERKEQRHYKDEDRRRYKEEDRKSYKDEDRKSYKDEDRKSYKDEERKSYKDEDRKSYKDEDRKYKDEDRKSYNDGRKPYREDDRRAYKEEDRKEYKTERTYKEESKLHKNEDRDRRNHGQDSRSNSSSTSKREDRERRRSPSPKTSRRPKSSSDEADDTGESTESDSDSAYERRKHKKSSSRKSRKHSKKSKHRTRKADNDSSADSDGSSHEDHRRHPSKYKKKTKKSKHARSRTRSRSRGRGR
ncbi:G-patch domain and KOW motifs-containing protein [Drosophila kikkawai]|uniref:G-patch domain and KOW motifs-containing protein n=1 Tax=Drosophila kikkawai TaxID=30033 RepID=A0A6P4IF37_DROKI|nr:TRAF3-interacting protein 1 [Drosophila kikkawai]